MTDPAWLRLTPTAEQKVLEWEIQQKVLTLVCEGGGRREGAKNNAIPRGNLGQTGFLSFLFFIRLTYRMLKATDAVIR